MSSPIQAYLALWLLATLIALIILFLRRHQAVLFRKDYLRFLARPWKLATFLIATCMLSFISTLGYDPTWDIPETVIMAVMTYYTAPYAVGIAHRFAKWIERNPGELYVAIVLMLFCSAWFYDAYVLFVLLGAYPLTAFSNLFISPFFYVLAGAMWSLDYRRDTGVVFAFKQQEWIGFRWGDGGFGKIFVYSLPMILFMTSVFGYFIWLNVR